MGSGEDFRHQPFRTAVYVPSIHRQREGSLGSRVLLSGAKVQRRFCNRPSIGRRAMAGVDRVNSAGSGRHRGVRPGSPVAPAAAFSALKNEFASRRRSVAYVHRDRYGRRGVKNLPRGSVQHVDPPKFSQSVSADQLRNPAPVRRLSTSVLADFLFDHERFRLASHRRDGLTINPYQT